MHPVQYLASRNMLSKNLGVSVYAVFNKLLTNVNRFENWYITGYFRGYGHVSQECEDQCKV